MSSRAEILRALRSQDVAPEPLPELAGEWICYRNKEEQFRLAVAQAAGAVVSLPDGTSLERAVRELEVVRRARALRSFVRGVCDEQPLPERAHGYAEVDVLIVAAELGVAENGAVWLGAGAEPERAACFLAEHLIVLLARTALVDNMHEAYARLGISFGAYGCFVSGPSKTADIEQALVIGAHGPRSLTIVSY